MVVEIPYGQEFITLELPEQFKTDFVLPQRPPPARSIEQEVKHALYTPISAPPLRSLVDKGNKIALICEDITRPMPLRIILPYILEELHKAKVPKSNITIFVALGSHRAMTPAEIEDKFGREISLEYEIRNSSIGDLAYLGQTPAGVPVYIDRQVSVADIKIGIGSVFPHPAVGYTGGAKIIYPGVAGLPTVAGLHLTAALLGRDVFGQVENPVRTEIEAWVEMVGLDFIVNATLLPTGEVYRIVAGHHIAAHRLGVKHCNAIYEAKAKHTADVVIASSAPADLDFWQAGKALVAASKIVREGGVIILVTPCYEGEGPHKGFLELCGRSDLEKLLLDVAKSKQLDPEVVLPMSVAALVRFVSRKARIIVVSEGLKREDVEAAGFSHFTNVNEAVESLVKKGRNITCAIIPYGGHTLPVLEKVC